MKSLFILLPFLGVFTLADEVCQCPQVKCSADDAVTLCNCRNNSETLCKQQCPDYTPQYVPCPASPTSLPPPTVSPSCTCDPTYCNKMWPESCYCMNEGKKACFDKCGGAEPEYQECPALPKTPSAPSVSLVEPGCTCEPTYCNKMWPESCYCMNKGRKACFDKCGGEEPEYQSCPPLNLPQTLKTVRARPLWTPSPTAAKCLAERPPSSSAVFPTNATVVPAPSPSPSHAVCGGGRRNYRTCVEGHVCIRDPTKPGCGPECDGLGICVQDKMCGGFIGLSCAEKGQVCVDDPRDDCDPKNGGADCGGLCMWKTE